MNPKKYIILFIIINNYLLLFIIIYYYLLLFIITNINKIENLNKFYGYHSNIFY